MQVTNILQLSPSASPEMRPLTESEYPPVENMAPDMVLSPNAQESSLAPRLQSKPPTLFIHPEAARANGRLNAGRTAVRDQRWHSDPSMDVRPVAFLRSSSTVDAMRLRRSNFGRARSTEDQLQSVSRFVDVCICPPEICCLIIHTSNLFALLI
jgi:hypothetical protein